MNKTIPDLFGRPMAMAALAATTLFVLPAYGASAIAPVISDAFVASGPTGNLGNNNYGGGGALAVAAGNLPNGEFQSVLKFDLSGSRALLDAQFGAGAWTIESVSLQLTSSPHNNTIYNDVAPGVFGISLLQDNSWIEGTGNASNPSALGITYNTLLNTFINNAVDQPLGTFNFVGGTSGANRYSLGLSPALTSDILAGTDMTLRLLAADNGVSYLFSSRTGTSGDVQPQLIITAVPEPTTLAVLAMPLGILLWRIRRPTRPAIPLQAPRLDSYP